MTRDEWFANCGGCGANHDLIALREGIRAGRLNDQDAYGCTALMLAAWSDWAAGVDELLLAGADTEPRHFRTGCTALYEAIVRRKPAMADRLFAGGANPDAPNHWGVTPRRRAPELSRDVPVRVSPTPAPRFQNAEHLADHHHPHFEIPELTERIALPPGRSVDLYVYGPKRQGKDDVVKVRINGRTGVGRDTRYTAELETSVEQTHLSPGTTSVEFGPEHVATAYAPRPARDP